MNKSAVNPTRNPFRKGTRTVKTIQGSCIVARHSWGRLQIWTDKNISWFRNRELGGWVFSSMSKDFVLGSARTSHYLEGCLRSAMACAFHYPPDEHFQAHPISARSAGRKQQHTGNSKVAVFEEQIWVCPELGHTLLICCANLRGEKGDNSTSILFLGHFIFWPYCLGVPEILGDRGYIFQFGISWVIYPYIWMINDDQPVSYSFLISDAHPSTTQNVSDVYWCLLMFIP